MNDSILLSTDSRGVATLTLNRPEKHNAFDDALIAAVAESAGMTVVTRNIKHFEPLGVPCLNPWDATAFEG